MDDLTRRIFKSALRALQSPGAQQVLSSERLIHTLLKAFTLRKDFRDVVDARIRSMARSMNLLTREDLREVEWTLRDVERRLRTLEAKVSRLPDSDAPRADSRAVLKAATKAKKRAKASLPPEPSRKGRKAKGAKSRTKPAAKRGSTANKRPDAGEGKS